MSTQIRQSHREHRGKNKLKQHNSYKHSSVYSAVSRLFQVKLSHGNVSVTLAAGTQQSVTPARLVKLTNEEPAAPIFNLTS